MTLFPELPRAQIRLGPRKARDANSGMVHVLGGIEHGIDHCSLGRHIANIAEGETEWMCH